MCYINLHFTYLLASLRSFVNLSYIRTHRSTTKRRRKTKTINNVPHNRIDRSANFCWKIIGYADSHINMLALNMTIRRTALRKT